LKNIVAIETSTEACSVALLCADNIEFKYRVEPRIHAKVILPMMNELLADAGITPLQLDAVAFGRGPGAFTGVRIATAAAQAIALGADIPVAPVSSLAAIALRRHRLHGETKIAAAIDARMGEVYWGAYEIHNQLPKLVRDERVCLPQAVDELDNTWCGYGSGWETYETELADTSGAGISGNEDAYPHAYDVLSIGRQILQQGQGVSADSAHPVYLRDNVALTLKQRAEKC